MAEKKILFKRGTSDKLPASKLANALYFVTDKGQLYLGDDLIADKTGDYADAINNAIVALDATIRDETGLIKVTIVETDGKLTSITVNQEDLLAEFQKYKPLQTAVTDPTVTDEKTLEFIDTISQDENGVISATKRKVDLTAVDTLIGNDKDKSVRTIANEELAAQLLSEEADASFKTLQELAAWLEDHPESVAEINQAISEKADKVKDATANNFAGLDANGNLIDSNKSANDFATYEQGQTADNALQSVEILGKTLTKTSNSITIDEAKEKLGLGSAAYTDANAYDAKDTAKNLIGEQVSADGQVTATGIYALIQGATRNTVKDCVDSIGALITQLEWDSF